MNFFLHMEIKSTLKLRYITNRGVVIHFSCAQFVWWSTRTSSEWNAWWSARMSSKLYLSLNMYLLNFFLFLNLATGSWLTPVLYRILGISSCGIGNHGSISCFHTLSSRAWNTQLFISSKAEKVIIILINWLRRKTSYLLAFYVAICFLIVHKQIQEGWLIC